MPISDAILAVLPGDVEDNHAIYRGDRLYHVHISLTHEKHLC